MQCLTGRLFFHEMSDESELFRLLETIKDAHPLLTVKSFGSNREKDKRKGIELCLTSKGRRFSVFKVQFVSKSNQQVQYTKP